MSTVSATRMATASMDRIDLALACLAVDRRLGGIIFVDLPPELLPHLGHRLGAMLADDHADAETVNLGAVHNEDDLWWLPRLTTGGGGFRFEMSPGPLVDFPGSPPRTLLIPDLATASLAVARAAVTIIGADHATADRHGYHASWQPRSRWLAACASSDLSRLSSHLLDRFCVRVDVSGLQRGWREQHEILTAVNGDSADGTPQLAFPLPPTSGQWRATQKFPRMTSEAIETVVATSGEGQVGARRDLALTRLARAIALLKGNDEVRKTHVSGAAALIGLAPTAPAESTNSSPRDETQPVPEEGQEDRSPGIGEESPSTAAEAETGLPAEDLPAGDGNEPTPPALLDPAKPSDLNQSRPYPEDDPGSISEYAPLRERGQRTDLTRAARGRVIGTEPTKRLSEMAVVPTAFEAAKFQPLRRKDNSVGPGLIISGSDLRRYRYQPKPDTGIVLILDHTSRRNWDFAAAIAPYLRWAYVQHAIVSMVELGYQGAANELRATAYRARSVLDGRIAISLGRAPGRATPLAHALDIGVQEMRRHLRQSEVVAGNSWFVVASDGRGNVPLQASQRGETPGLVAREGITDALRAARAVRAIAHVHKIVVAPPKLTHYAQLPFDLATEMGGIVAEDPR